MKIRSLFEIKGRAVISFEIFPPKKDGDIESIYAAIKSLTALKPDFISVTYGAGGSGGRSGTVEISHHLKKHCGSEPLAHLTGAYLTEDTLQAIICDLQAKGVENILALRGDLVKGEAFRGEFPYARDLIPRLKKCGFCVGAAAYPESHIESASLDEDIAHMKEKQDAGADFFITQLFFDNNIFYNFMDKAAKAGISKPVSAGIMPILSRAQIERMIFMCGASLPSAIIKLVNKYGEQGRGLVEAGVEYACEQMRGLIGNGAQGIHIYTMNKPDIAKYCVERLPSRK